MTHYRDDKPLYNSVIIKNFIEYMKIFHPEIDPQETLNYAGIASYELDDSGHWLNQTQVDRFYEKLSEQTMDPGVARRVGRYSASSQTSRILRKYALKFLTPAAVYWMIQKFTSRITRATTFKTKRISANKVEVTVKPDPGILEKPYQCENRIGWLESLTKPFTNKFAKIDHPQCIHKGDDMCRYVITWTKSPSIQWKSARDATLYIGLLSVLPFYFIMPLELWIISLSSIAALFLFISNISLTIENKELAKNTEVQGNMAKDLLNEINYRYNNALLMQEIGQATSSIVERDKLIAEVVMVIQKHLDFDRGVIMLADEDRKQLVYSAGYGYSKEKEERLRKARFHLDRPDSRGIFVVAFREQTPFLINDMSEIENLFSKRSQVLVKEMDVQSLICVPIIYKEKSLGIIAVDNVKSKRPLTQSDVSLLVGVASQTAVSIVNAMAFKKLRESEQKYRDLVENANSIIMRMDTRGRITFFNEFAQTFFGYRESEILNANVHGTILPDSDLSRHGLKKLVALLSKNPARHIVGENENIRHNGDRVWIAWTYKAIFDPGGDVKEILCIGNDISELKQAAKEKKDLETRLIQAQKMEAIGTLAGGIAHDFNNILQSIYSYVQLIMLTKDRDGTDYDRLDTILKSVKRATDLTRRLLIFSRKVESNLEPVDLNQEVVQVAKMLERTIPKMIEIELRLAANIETVKADVGQIEQIMMNLAVNARDAMPDGGKLIFRTENVTLDERFCENQVEFTPGDYVLLTITDTGSGMSKDTRQHIFEPFYTTKETGKGTGLGLAMVYGIVKSHRGHITCESGLGKGTTFKIYLPIVQEQREKEVREEVESSLKPGTETILLVDDEEDVRKGAEELLTTFGYRVLTAEDGESALAFYEKEHHRVDLVILDLIMPGMGGRRCLEKLIQINPGVKVLIASGYAVDGYTKEFVGQWAKGFISKPYEVREVLDATREVLDQNRESL